MTKAQLVVALRSHLPFGASGAERVSARIVEPVIEALERHPAAEIGWHIGGTLLEWLEAERNELLERLVRLAAAKRVEFLGGGMYSPAMTLFSEGDVASQIELMSEVLEQRFGARPRGLWLPGLLWEPHLASLFARLGLEYTLLDAQAFSRAGLTGRPSGYFATDQAGDALAVFPIDGTLRALAERGDATGLLQELEGGDRVLAEDLHRLDRGAGVGAFLDDLFTRTEAEAVLVKPSAYLDTHPCGGRIYLPPSAHPVQEEWLRAHGGALPWSSVLRLFPEANRLHKKIALVSRKLTEALADDGSWEEVHEAARRNLYRAESANAFWADTGAGIDQPAIRQALFEALLGAEDVLDRRSQGEDDWISFDQADFDGDLAKELLVENAHLNAYIDPGEGGVITELDARHFAANLADVPSRRPTNGPALDELDSPPGTDLVPRACLMDRFPAPGTALEELERGSYREEGDFLSAPYEVVQVGIDEEGSCDFTALLRREGKLVREGRDLPLCLEKHFRVPADAGAVQVTYRLQNLSDDPIDLLFCPEVNLRLPFSDPGGQFYDYEGAHANRPRLRSAGEIEDAEWLTLVDVERRLQVRLDFSPPTAVLRYPVDTLERNGEEWQRIFQGSAIAPRWELSLPPRSVREFQLELTFGSIEEEAVVPMEGE